MGEKGDASFKQQQLTLNLIQSKWPKANRMSGTCAVPSEFLVVKEKDGEEESEHKEKAEGYFDFVFILGRGDFTKWAITIPFYQ